MNENEKSAYLMSQTVCALAELMDMFVRDSCLAAQGESAGMSCEGEYEKIPVKYGIHHNAVMGLLNS